MSESNHSSGRLSRRRTKDRSPLRKWVKGLELTGGILICILVAATPWLYGTTERWAVNLMNASSLAAAAILGAAAVFHRISRAESEEKAPRSERAWRYSFLALNVSLLVFCGIAWINARAAFSVEEQSFTYRDYIKWLPTTYDARLTREAFVNFLACFGVFWACRYWLGRGWERAREKHSESSLLTVASNRRFSALMWVVSLNGMLLAVQGILQRLSGSSKLLWLRPGYYPTAAECFGPFSYRGNAAEYLNLIWPVALAFWWLLTRERRRLQNSARIVTDGPELLLIPAVILIAAAAVISLSRGGALVAGSLMLLALVVIAGQKGVSKLVRIGGLAVIVAVVSLFTWLEWTSLVGRFQDQNLSDLSGREEIYRNSKQIASEYPVFGTGPGSFRSVYHLYRDSSEQLWHGFLHDDWLETLVTFGWVGFGMVLTQFLILPFWIGAPGKAPAPRVFVLCYALALAGVLAHAKFDFPMQTYSIMFTFVVLTSALTTVTPTRP